VGIVAVGTRHEPFVDAVLEGHRELAADVGVAAVTKVGLTLRKQKFRDRRFVNGVAIGADYVVQSVGGAADVGAAQGFGVAAQAVVENLLGLQFRKSNNRGLAAPGFDVGLTGAVAALASGTVWRFFSGGDALVMGVLVEVGPNVGVASAAYVATDETGSRCWLLSFEKKRKEKKGEEA
jgi:hypothetical protein